MAITVEPIGNSLRVRFPFALKDNFKGVFKTAKWDGENKAWTVSADAQVRLAQWIEAVTPVVEDIEEASQAEMSEKELRMLEYDILMLRTELAKQKVDIRSLSESAELISQATTELETLKQERKAQQLALEKAMAESKAALEQICDIDRIVACYKMMVSTHNAKTTEARHRFKEAAAVIAKQHTKLRAAGYRCIAMETLGEMNANRPDRDSPKDISLTELFCLAAQKEFGG